MSERAFNLALAIVAATFAVGAIWWAVAQWHECRGAGLSVFYCIQHIG